jgi:hypothetical protein
MQHGAACERSGNGARRSGRRKSRSAPNAGALFRPGRKAIVQFSISEHVHIVHAYIGAFCIPPYFDSQSMPCLGAAPRQAGRSPQHMA